MDKNRPHDELLDHDYDGIQEYDNQLPGWWKWLFYISIVFGVVYMMHYHVLGTGDLSRVEYLKEMNPTYSSTLDAGGGGLLAPYHSPFFSREENLTPRVRSELRRISDASFDESLIRAMAKANPAQLEKLKAAFPDVYARFASGAGPSQAAEAAAPEQTISAPINNPAVLATGKQIFETQCFTCHGKLGEGGVGPNLTDNYWIHGGTIADVIHTIRKGVPEKGMITWEKTLTPAQIDAVASFIFLKLQGTHPPNAKAPQGVEVQP